MNDNNKEMVDSRRIINAYSIYDMVAELFSEFPFPAHNDMVACRSFDKTMLKSGTGYDNPLEFNLYRVGSYDQMSGLLIPLDAPVIIREGRQTMKEAEIANSTDG